MQDSLSAQAITDSSAAMYSIANQSPANQSPEDRQLPVPIATLNRENVVPISSGADSLREMARRLASVESELRAVKAKLATEGQVTEWMAQFERSQKQTRIKQAKITHAQNQQLERRLQQVVKDLIVSMVPDAVRRVVRIRGPVVHEPTMQPSTYRVPRRENTGIYS